MSDPTETVPAQAPPGGENTAPSPPPLQRRDGVEDLQAFARALQEWAARHGGGATMTTMPKITWNADAIRRVEEASAQRLDASRPVQFTWKTVEGRDGGPLQDRILGLRLETGEAREQEDMDALLAALAEIEAIFLNVFEDFTAVIEVEKCPRCGAWPLQCVHVDPSAAYASPVDAHGHGGTSRDPSWRNTRLRNSLIAAGDRKRAELAADREQRIAQKKAQVTSIMRQVEEVSP